MNDEHPPAPALAIRTARPEDAEALAESQRDIARVPGRLASQPGEIHAAAIRAEIQRGRGHALVAEADGAIVGHALLTLRDLAATSHIAFVTLAVHEGHQGKGIGRRLMDELLARARADPRVEKVELNVRCSNDRAIALYRSLGFVEEGRITNRIKLGPGEYVDDLYMALWVGERGVTDSSSGAP